MKNYITISILFLFGFLSIKAQVITDYTPQLIDVGTIPNGGQIEKTLNASLTPSLGDVLVFTLDYETNIQIKFPAFNDAYVENHIWIVKRNWNSGSMEDILYGNDIYKDFPLYGYNEEEARLYCDENGIDMYSLYFRLTPGTYMITSRSSDWSYVESGYSPYNISIQLDMDLTIKPLNPSENKNYITKIVPTVETKFISYNNNNIKFDGPVEANISTSYFDGLGRPIQAVQHEITPDKKDLVTLQEYDNFGRESRTWLPSDVSDNNGKYITPSIIKTQAKSLYGDSKPYTEIKYEDNPLNITSEQYGPGQDWHSNGKSVKTKQFINTGSGDLSCNFYKTEGKYNDTRLIKAGKYPAGELIIKQIIDEDSNISYEFRNRLGQVILNRQINYNKENNKELVDTYFVFDVFGNLSYVLPPLAIDKQGGDLSDNNEIMDQYAYLYKYDPRNRCISKKLPGCDWILYVYDKADQLILSQDGEQRIKREWQFTIPDVFGRPVLSGISEERLDVGDKIIRGQYTTNGTYHGYIIRIDDSIHTFATSPVIHTVNYYDNYDFLTHPDAWKMPFDRNSDYDRTYMGDTDPLYANTNYTAKGMLTGSKTALLDDSNTFLRSALYYDQRQRIVQSRAENHLGGIEVEFIAYNFTGQPVSRRHAHTSPAWTDEYFTYTYDHAGRLLETKHSYRPGFEVSLSKNEYDELGRLVKTVRNNNNSLDATYAYNVRSWLTKLRGYHFHEDLTYNYNGNISHMSWTQDGKNRKYNYAYDNLSRLTAATYQGGNDEKYGTSYTYDKHGNILTLIREGKTTATTYGAIDNLTMEYSGNQMIKTEDAIPLISLAESADFKNYSNAAIEYTYNKNGAMTQDLNKGISRIQYNSLNLPMQMDIKNPGAEARNEYLYTASGVKLRVTQRWNPHYYTNPIIGTDVNESTLTATKTTDYVSNKVYENGTLKKILIDGGYIEDGVYYFYLGDHLGNNRVVARSDGAVMQRNHYYPFGMSFADDENPNTQDYKYNGKELDRMNGLNLYDYSARQTLPDIGNRFTSVDPLAEDYYSISPYVYCLNNPLKYIDPTGMSSYTYNWDLGIYQDEKGNEVSFTTVYDSLFNNENDEVTDDEPETTKSKGGNSKIKTLDKSPLPIQNFLSGLFTGNPKEKESKHSYLPVAVSAAFGADGEAYYYVGQFSLGGGVILRGKNSGQAFGQFSIGTLGMGGFGFSLNYATTFYFYVGELKNFDRKSLDGLSLGVNISYNNIKHVFSVDATVNFSVDAKGGYVIAVSGGAGLGKSFFPINGYVMPSYTTTWDLFKFW